MRRLHLARSYRDAVVSTLGLVGYWRLGEASGTVAADETGANPGTYVNTPTLGVTGLLAGDPNTAVSFVKASSEYVLVKSGRILSGLNASTVIAWVSTPALPTSNRALYTERGAAGNDIYEFQMELTTGRPRFILRDTAGTIDQIVATTGTYANNGTHMLAVTKQGTALTLYADGAAIKTATLTASDTFSGTVTTRLAGDQADANLYLDGTLDEVAIFDRALAGAEVARRYQIGRGF